MLVQRLVMFLFISICVGESIPYFQQHVAYDIEVTLNDSSHTLNAYEKIIYTNNSPDTLDFIWFHLWPNAYKNTETAAAKQAERFLSTKFIYTKEKDRGYIDSLHFKVDGIDAETIVHEEWIDVTKLILPKPIFPGENIVIETPFHVKIPKVISRLGHIGKHYEITQWYPKPAVYDRDGWHPMPYLNMGEFYSEFGSFDVSITLPKEYRIMATGDLIDGELEYAWLDSLAEEGDSLHAMEEKALKKALKELTQGKKKNFITKIQSFFKKEVKKEEPKKEVELKTVHFYQENVHDFAWFADKTWIVRKGTLYLADSTREVTLWSMYKPKNAELWENSIEYLHDAGYWYSKFNGNYPYNHITAVDGDLSAGGGMEYPNITVISKMDSKHLLEMVIMHEVGHNWFYGILGNNERDYTWMDEGLNEFCNIRYWDKKYGYNNRRWILNEFIQTKMGPFSIGKNLQFGFFEYAGYTSWVKQGDEEPLSTSSNNYQRRANYWLSYAKPLVFSWHLLDYLGESTIDTIMHNYYKDWKFKHPYPEDYFSYVKNYSNKNVEWYTEDVFYTTKNVDYGVSIVENDAIFINYGTMTIPFEVAFYDKKRNEISRSWIEGVNRVKATPLPNGTKSIIIDPDHTLPDVNPVNNATSKPIKLTWVFDQPQYDKTEIFWMPWVFNFNYYNGWTPGFNFHHGYVPGYDYGIAFRPMWDFHNQKLIGSIKYQKSIYGLDMFYESKLNFNIAKHSGQTGGYVEFNGKSKKHLKRYPVWNSEISIDYHNIKEGIVDPYYYTSGEVLVGYSELQLHNRPNPFLNYYFRTGLQLGIQNSQFLRFHMQTNIYYKLSKKIRTKIRIWAGGFIDKTNLPKQYRTYLSGNIDPNFRNSYIYNRTNDVENFPIGIQQYDVGGPSIHGLLLSDRSISSKMKSFDNWLISINFDITIPKIPGKPFIDLVSVMGGSSYVDVGIKKSFGPVLVILPLYQSWDLESTTVTDTDWIINRMRVSLDIADFNIQEFF